MVLPLLGCQELTVTDVQSLAQHVGEDCHEVPYSLNDTATCDLIFTSPYISALKTFSFHVAQFCH